MRLEADDTAREVAAFLAAAVGGFLIVFLLGNPLTSLAALAASLLLLVLIIGAVIVLQGGDDRQAMLEDELGQLADVIAAQEDIPNQEQVLYELDRADRALDRGNPDEAEEAINEIERLLSS